MSRITKMPENNKPIFYSPTAAKVYRFCQKKYYFNWLVPFVGGWKKPAHHPWRQLHELKQIKHLKAWQGDLYHQLVAYTLNRALQHKSLDEQETISLTEQIATAQFAFSLSKSFVGAVKSRVPSIQGISTFLALSEHAYDQPSKDSLRETVETVTKWLSNTFVSPSWSRLLGLLGTARNVFIEPSELRYTIAGAQVFVRMDVGIETLDNRFILYDWKCYRDNEIFTDYNQSQFKHQLLVYALWPVRRDIMPIPIDQITAYVFNPITIHEEEVTFTEEDYADFELEAVRWVSLHKHLFDNVAEIDFEDLEGPFDSSRSCPWCPYKAICGKDIPWNTLT